MEREKPFKILQRQPINRRVVIALLPCVAGSVYFFGWRCLLMVLWAWLIGFLTEYIFCRKRAEAVTEAVFVTSTIFALIMPPSVPWHVLTIGVIFGVAFSKEIFGGFGRNFFNPAMAGRCFVYVCFPIALTSTWAPVADEKWGALDRWSTVVNADAVTAATPMAHLKAGRIVLADSDNENVVLEIPADVAESKIAYVSKKAFLRAQIIGRLSGTMGVTSVVLILIGGVYLFYTKTASRKIILSLIITYAVLTELLHQFDVEPVSGALPAVLGGGFLFGAFFMATDPVTAPRTEAGKVIFGILIGVCTTVIRNFSIFNGGLMFSILIGNMFAPILDYAVKSYKESKTTIARTE